MRHECDTCGYSWLDAVPSAKCVEDRCGVCRMQVARDRIASGHYQRSDVLDAVAEIIEEQLRKEAR